MLNTPDELRTYPDAVNERLDELFDQYGLLLLGWSAAWDPALRDALARCPSRRYPTTWLDRRELSEPASRLAQQRDATIVTAPADEWLTQLADACTILQTEADRIRQLPALDPTTVALNTSTYTQRLPTLEAELELWAALVATLAYWGDDKTDAWWTSHIPRFAIIPGLSGSTDVIELLTAPAVVALYAGGAAGAASGRWGLVSQLLGGLTAPLYSNGQRVPAATVIGPAMVYPHSRWPSRALCQLLTPVLVDAVGLGSTVTQDGWERFEYLAYAVALDRHERDQAANVARPMPYLRVTDDWSGGRRATASVIRAQFDDSPASQDALVRQLFDGDLDRYITALNRADEWIAGVVSVVDQAQNSRMQPGVAYFMPSGERYAAIPDDTL